MSDENAEKAKEHVISRIDAIVEGLDSYALDPEETRSFLEMLHSDLEDIMTAHEAANPEAYEE